MKVALVDDEKNIRFAVKTAFEKAGFSVLEYCNGQEALDALLGNDVPDIYVLDIMMPVMDGILFLQKYKAIKPQIPAIFLTSRDEEFDRILGLELGADDYICKPFSLQELITRVNVVLRRYSQTVSKPLPPADSGSIQINSESFTATLGGSPLSLTVTEFRLLEGFINNKNIVLSREQLIEIAYPEDIYLNDRAIDCHIKRLRKKIGSDRIETIYGLGYKYCD